MKRCDLHRHCRRLRTPTNELLIREALHPYPGNANYLRQCAHMSARRLSVEQIDLYYLHSGWAKDASFEDQCGTLAELRQLGLIRHIGLSNVTPDQPRAACQIVDITAVTAHFNVVARQQAMLLEAALEAGAVFAPWQPVSLSTPGAPTDTGVPEAVRRVLGPIASRHGATISQIALAWLLARSPAIMPIPGTTSIAHVRENLDAQDIELSREDIQSINGIAPERTATQSLPLTSEPRFL